MAETEYSMDADYMEVNELEKGNDQMIAIKYRRDLLNLQLQS
jgi:hypothetical protein